MRGGPRDGQRSWRCRAPSPGPGREAAPTLSPSLPGDTRTISMTVSADLPDPRERCPPDPGPPQSVNLRSLISSEDPSGRRWSAPGTGPDTAAPAAGSPRGWRARGRRESKTRSATFLLAGRNHLPGHRGGRVLGTERSRDLTTVVTINLRQSPARTGERNKECRHRHH